MMPRGLEITGKQKGMVEALLNEGHTIMQIAAKLGVPKLCVGRLKKKLQERCSTSNMKK